jgi:hypothetical protein
MESLDENRPDLPQYSKEVGDLDHLGMPLSVDDASQTREVISSSGSQETIFLAEEVVFREWRRWAEIITGQHRA